MRENLIEIDTSIDAKDLRRFYASYYLTFNNIFVFFVAFVIFGTLIFFLFSNREIKGLQFGGIIVASLLFSYLFSLLLIYFSLVNAKKYGEMKCKYIFSDNNVEIVAESFKARIDWKYFVRAAEEKNYFFLYNKSSQHNLIPKKFFRDHAQLASFKELLADKLGEKAQLKKTKQNLGLK